MDPTTYAGLWQLADLFCAHFDAYVKDSGVHINEPVTPELLAKAYIDKWAVSGYTARLDGDKQVTHVGAIDFDHPIEGDEESVRLLLSQWDIPTLRVGSRRGSHLWVVSREEGPAAEMRRMLEQAIRLSGDGMLDRCEVFPKPGASKFGSGALRLPLMTHPKTGLRYPAYDMAGKRLTKLWDVVLATPYVEWAPIHKLAKDVPIDYPRRLGEYRKVREYTDNGSAVAILAALGVEARPAKGCRCPFHEDAHASLSVAEDDQRVWCKAPECIAYNGGRGVGTLALARMVRERNG